jgi:hypothetical protein
MVGDKRVLHLDYEGHKYPCLDRGWMSWANKVLVPHGEGRRKHGLIDEETGRNKRWSISTVRKFLEMTPTDIADQVVKSWWERHNPTDWHVVKYADAGQLGAIRYIGTNRYRLYRNIDFLRDLSGSEFASLHVRDSTVNENHMILRVTGNQPLDIEGVDVFAGYHIYNSENGCSSIGIKHMIYDKVCTNGMIIVFNADQILNQRHSKFDEDVLRQRVIDISKLLPEIHRSATSLVSRLVNIKLDTTQIDAVLAMYKARVDASNKFIEDARQAQPRYGNTAWGVLSSITETAQNYNWETRMNHEEQASDIVDSIESGEYEKYIEKEDEDEEKPN